MLFCKFNVPILGDTIFEVLLHTYYEDIEYVVIQFTPEQYKVVEKTEYAGNWGELNPTERILYQAYPDILSLVQNSRSLYRFLEVEHYVTLIGELNNNKKAQILLKKR